ncbi:MAG: hypothetical protein ACR2JM_14240 [Mycobacterium sp.]
MEADFCTEVGTVLNARCLVAGLGLALAALTTPVAAADPDPAPAPPPAPVPVAGDPAAPAPVAEPAPSAPPDGVSHLPSPDSLPPGTTQTAPEHPKLGYLQEIWQAVKSKDVTMSDALLLIAQRPLDAVPPGTTPQPDPLPPPAAVPAIAPTAADPVPPAPAADPAPPAPGPDPAAPVSP